MFGHKAKKLAKKSMENDIQLRQRRRALHRLCRIGQESSHTAQLIRRVILLRLNLKQLYAGEKNVYSA